MDVRVLLRLEGLATAAGALALYAELDISWWLLPALGLLPDVAFVAYGAGPRVGAAAYNLTHNVVLPITLALIGYIASLDVAAAIALVWLFHIGVDRLLGYGLKYPTAFKDTHLQRL